MSLGRVQIGGLVLGRVLVLVQGALMQWGAAMIAGWSVLLGGCGAPSSPGPAAVRRVMGEPGRSPGQYLYPRAIDADASGLWVIDKTGRVQQIDPRSGRGLAGFEMPDREQGLPTGVTLGPMPGDPSRSALWIPDTHYYRVAVYDPQTGTPVTDFGTHGTGPGQFIYLTDIAVLTDDAGAVRRVYVSEYGGNDRVSVFDASLTFLFSFGRFGVGTPERQGETLFNRPQSLDIDPARGEVVVADACNHRLGRFTLDGELIAWIGAPSAAVFSYPYGVRLLEGGRALVAEFGGNRVSVVDLDSGRVVERLGEAGREPGAFAAPWGVAVVGDEAYILDSGNNRVQVIESPGRGSIRYPAPSASRGRS